MARMIAQSKIIAYHDELQAALLAALKVADKKLFGSIQFRPMPEAGVLQVSALNPYSTFLASVPLEMCDVVDKRDEIFEVSIPEATVLAKFPIKLPPGSDDELAKSGLIISEGWLQITDETGLGMGIRHARVRRNSEISLPGSASRTIDAAQEIGTGESLIYPRQIDLLGKVGGIMGEKSQIRVLDTPELLSRVILMGATYALTVTEGRENGQPGDDDGDDGPQPDQPLNFDDGKGMIGEAAVEAISEASAALKSMNGTVRFVSARPPGGAS